MSDWSEQDSSTFRAIAEIGVPRRREMMAMLLGLVPFAATDPFRVVEIGSGDGLLAETILDRFQGATLLALDGSVSMREAAKSRISPFADRADVRSFELATVDWWDLMRGADLVVSSLCLHHLNDAKKQYLYKAVAERLSPRGAFLIADFVEPLHAAARRLAAEGWDTSAREQAHALGEPQRFAQFGDAKWNHYRFPDSLDRPSALFHHLIWLKHAGFHAVDCVWMFAGHAVFAGFK